MTPDEFVEKWTFGMAQPLKPSLTADLSAILTADRRRVREEFKSIFIWRDGEPYYYTRNGMPMEIPERIIKKIKAAAIWKQEG